MADLTQAPDKARLTDLPAVADVRSPNLWPGKLTRKGFPRDRLEREFPRLIVRSITGHGETGPMADRKTHDLLIRAESGPCSITGGSGAPARAGISMADIATGASAHAAIPEAPIRRGFAGRGTAIPAWAFEVIADWLAVPWLQHEGDRPPRCIGQARPSIAPFRDSTRKDGTQRLIAC